MILPVWHLSDLFGKSHLVPQTHHLEWPGVIEFGSSTADFIKGRDIIETNSDEVTE